MAMLNQHFQLELSDFNWTDDDFERPAQAEVIIYELHIGDFASDGENHGTFNDVTESIQQGYFNDLGINAIELICPLTNSKEDIRGVIQHSQWLLRVHMDPQMI